MIFFSSSNFPSIPLPGCLDSCLRSDLSEGGMPTPPMDLGPCLDSLPAHFAFVCSLVAILAHFLSFSLCVYPILSSRKTKNQV